MVREFIVITSRVSSLHQARRSHESWSSSSTHRWFGAISRARACGVAQGLRDDAERARAPPEVDVASRRSVNSYDAALVSVAVG
jgi:hypothetical protein